MVRVRGLGPSQSGAPDAVSPRAFLERTWERMDVVPEPSSKACLIEVATRQGEDRGYDLFLGGIDAKAVQTEEEVHGLEGHPLVSIHEGVVLGDPKAVCRSQRGKISVGLAVDAVAGTFESGFQEAPVPKAEGSAVSLDLIRVDRQNVDRTKPAWLGHLASSRRALRYRLAPSA